jgi:hypothetical protein
MGDPQALVQAVAADIPVPPAAYDVRESTDDRVLDIGPGAHPAPTHRFPATGERSEEQRHQTAGGRHPPTLKKPRAIDAD